MISITSNPSTYTQPIKAISEVSQSRIVLRHQKIRSLVPERLQRKDDKIQTTLKPQSKTMILPSSQTSNQLVSSSKAEFQIRSLKNSKRSQSITNLSSSLTFPLKPSALTPDYLSISSGSKTGIYRNRPKEINQDAIAVLKNINNNPNHLLFAVFDGNGPEGHKISHYLKEKIIKLFPKHFENEENKIFKRSPHDSIKIFLKKLEKKLNSSNLDLKMSGSTLISLQVNGSQVVWANIGDSRAMIIGFERSWYSKTLNKVHRPGEVSESIRIREAGGEIKRLKNSSGEDFGPLRVWNGKNDPGLNVSRAFGDFYLKDFGVTSDPDIQSFFLKESDKCLVVASDGIWDAIDDCDVVDIVKKHWDRLDSSSAVAEIISVAFHRALKKFSYADDASVVVMFRK
jgi:serine/threonine protein phosphatase PrpC